MSKKSDEIGLTNFLAITAAEKAKMNANKPRTEGASPEQMAERHWALFTVIRETYTHAQAKAEGVKLYLAGFQKCESTVAQPLREQLEWQAAMTKALSEAQDRYVPQIAALTAENEKLVAQLEADVELISCGGCAELEARVSSLTAALEKAKEALVDGTGTGGVFWREKAVQQIEWALAAMGEGKADE